MRRLGGKAKGKVRWGRLAEIRHVKRIPSAAFDGLARRLKHLASWRGMHLARRHSAIRSYARRRGVAPSSDLPLKLKVGYVTKRLP